MIINVGTCFLSWFRAVEIAHRIMGEARILRLGGLSPGHGERGAGT